MNKFKIEVATVSDRDNIVVEIWFEDKMLAEVSREKSNAEIEFYFDSTIAFDLEDFLDVIEKAKNKIMI